MCALDSQHKCKRYIYIYHTQIKHSFSVTVHKVNMWLARLSMTDIKMFPFYVSVMIV